MRVLVTGGTGMVGSAFNEVRTAHDLFLVGSADAELCVRGELTGLLREYNPDAVVHLAAKVGGVKGNSDFVADFYSQNTLINCNVLEECHNFGIQNVISLLSTCVYPDKVTYPLTEDQIHSGEPHKSNFGYAYAKRMLDVHSRALRKQHGRNYICAVPNNIYGPFDNFDLENGHVIPSIIRKVWEARTEGKVPVLWGDGSPLREFTFSSDIASALLFLLDSGINLQTPCNIGSTGEYSISDVTKIICNNLDFDYNEIVWDKSKPSGQFRKPSSNSVFSELGYDTSSYVSLEEGLERTCRWFVKNYPNVRGV